ncbi:hypothetical protein FPV67DRAFT_1469564 [Lyophyllum atratum]|nr:hypothetical protein FPV67DRAFT_1469564 [Lyophyllum atratum]
MTTPRLPAVRLPGVNGGECITPDGVVLELPLSSKFSVTWPSDTRLSSTPPASERSNLSFSEGESESSDNDSGHEHKDLPEHSDDVKTMPTPVSPEMPTSPRSPIQPRFSRTLSMPLPSQLGYLKHPHRSNNMTPPEESTSLPITPDPSRLQELSIELADSVQMMIQTMLQISPPQLLDPAKEQFSACALSDPQSPGEPGSMDQSPIGTPVILTDFDIGEMLQSVGDSLSGAAAQAGVDLVLYHGDDIGLRHVCVRGDEGGISYALSHVVRQVLTTTQPGDSIELGLLVGPLNPETRSPVPSAGDDNAPELEGDSLSCTIRISHKYGTASDPSTPEGDGSTSPRIRPSFSTLLLRRLLHRIGATLITDLPPPKLFIDGRTCDFTLSLDRGSISVLNTPMVHTPEEDTMSGEPSVEQLILFAEGLKGKRVTLYANAKGSFAQHLTSYLTAWGMDVTHVSPEGEVDGLPDIPPSPSSPPPPGLPPTYLPKAENAATVTALKDPPTFIFIDDDIEVLKERLHDLREKPYQLNLNLRKRPSLAAHHRPRSSAHVARAMGISPPTVPVVVVHFTSLANYKVIKDIVQSIMASHSGSTATLPEVMIIPKPAGPRRFLTALHTAVTKPIVDPFFSPIATSPTSPSLTNGQFFHNYHGSDAGSARSSPKTMRPSGSRSNSDRSIKSTKDHGDFGTHPAPPSPLSMTENVEYFSEAAAKLGASPSSGLVIQSPDGQPAGIFFHPRGKAPRNPSAQSMERDKGQLQLPEQKRRGSRLSISNEPTSPISFSSLHAVATTSPQPSVEAWNAASPSARAAARKPSSPREDSATPTGSPTTPRRPPPVDTPKKATPPASPIGESHPITRKAAPRRATQESGAASAPTTLAAASKKVRAAADGNIVPPISVLIVDDYPLYFYEKKKIKYDLANNGQEAVQKWRTGGFHLILMDIQMPVMDGIQATKEIRRLEQVNAVAGYPPGTPSFEDNQSPMRTPSDTSIETRSASSPYRSSVIIVALTASSLQSDRVAALAAGCNDFLTKPVSLLWLNSKIIEWGSIKALQMWADLRPERMTMATEQAAQARNVAERLHVPKGRSTPSPSRSTASPAPSARTLNELAKDLAQGGRRTPLVAQASLAGVTSIVHVSEAASPALQQLTVIGEGDGNGDEDYSAIRSRFNGSEEPTP